jgi:hypothetical protein
MARKVRPTLQLFCLCDDIGRVEGSAKLILIGVFERIQVEGIPAQHAKMWVFARWTGGVGSFTSRTAILDPDEQVVFETEEIAFRLDSPEQSHNVSGQLVGFPIETEGTFWVEAYLDGELAARIPLVVEQVAYEESDEEAPPVLH